MYTLRSRLRDLWDAVVHVDADDETTLDRMTTRQGVIRLLALVPALDADVKALAHQNIITAQTLEVYMSQIQDALAEQGQVIGRLAGAMDDELAQLQAQLEDAQAKIDAEEAADLAEALVTVEGIRANTNQLAAMADQLQENDEVDEPAEPTDPDVPAEPVEPETPAEPETPVEEPTPEPTPEPETPVEGERPVEPGDDTDAPAQSR